MFRLVSIFLLITTVFVGCDKANEMLPPTAEPADDGGYMEEPVVDDECLTIAEIGEFRDIISERTVCPGDDDYPRDDTDELPVLIPWPSPNDLWQAETLCFTYPMYDDSLEWGFNINHLCTEGREVTIRYYPYSKDETRFDKDTLKEVYTQIEYDFFKKATVFVDKEKVTLLESDVYYPDSNNEVVIRFELKPHVKSAVVVVEFEFDKGIVYDGYKYVVKD